MLRKKKIAPDPTVSRSTLKMRLLKKLKCTTRFERELWREGAQLVAGVDEVGRGALFGPVVAGAVILDPSYRIKGLRDSKLLPAARRVVLAERIKQHCIAWAIAAVDVARIDQLNIYHASRLAMTEAVRQLLPAPDFLLIDALKLEHPCQQRSIIHGDALSASIAAASIVAKVERDLMISAWAPVFPAYDLASNKGYRSPKHLKALREYGPSPLHRQSFAPVWNAASPQEALEFILQEESSPEAEALLEEVELESAAADDDQVELTSVGS
ncbi:MAG TPA: ribonuclease HII [Terriglobales bacterium]|nr:ribonuclease HII [Terriglobales bacterium]